MADSTQTPTNSSNGTHSRTITLNDWWLVKSQNHFQGNRLAVSDISSRKEEAVQIFVSAPIIKRYDVFSLETADGIYVITRGFINEQRTLENGFTPQILKSFLYGFPPNWEIYALECIKEESEAGIDLANAVPENVFTICQEILSDGGEHSILTPLVFPEEVPGKCKKPFTADKCKVSQEINGVDVAYGSDENRRCTRLNNIKVYQQKQQPASEGPLKHLDIEQRSTSMEVENCDSDTAVSNNVSSILPEISPHAMENSFPTSFVTPEKATGDCKKSLLADELDKSIKMSKVNVIHGSVGNRRSVRLHNVKLGQKKQPATSKDHEITEIQEGLSLISPFRGSSPSLGRSAENMRDGKMIVLRTMQKL
ncbi:hypothetical protein TSUD_399660 [Trifolium subterraneum]|uniref:SANTA domain-containing protein n=1 Tax=Trifolium subterraneum TaxID=3900 RepID=A0A2Z6NI06_TRISU|nr:hypothetical protein TSUD_399660 [Trifolium subterraneum]